ncbi:uncharacterized protein LTR77_003455 [Saxophila tyrrhenica]|uniref:Uncharacterized protein n=1 Tax=Saxophila tyrrhenica TaxID=1690608 RepID=A0AAV9PI08_9PEZI|nr:hypothetical protein LTR77_003455 [Saxophila tyrrhenica]
MSDIQRRVSHCPTANSRHITLMPSPHGQQRSATAVQPVSTPAPGRRCASGARRARIQKPSSRARGRPRLSRGVATLLDGQVYITPAPEARDNDPPPNPSHTNPLRTDTSLHACSDSSLAFVASSGLQTSSDTDAIALNLMDYFLFSEPNWLPELLYCRLHAACFLAASRVTGLSNTAEQIADALGPDSVFVSETAALMAVDEEEAEAIRQSISLDRQEVEDGYRLLYERRNKLAVAMGRYAAEVEKLPTPHSSFRADEEVEKSVDVVEENFDVFEE